MDMYPTFAKFSKIPLTDLGIEFLRSRGIPPDLAMEHGVSSIGKVYLKSPLLTDTEREAVKSLESFVNKARGSLLVSLLTMEGDPIAIQARSLTDHRSFFFSYTPYGRFYAPLFGAYSQRDLLVKTGSVIITESAVDSLSVLLAEPSCPVLSPLTSHLTSRHVDWLSRFVTKVAIMFDNDRAGGEGVEDAIHKLEARGIKALVVKYSGKDPNDFLLKYGIEAMRSRVSFVSSWATM